MPLALGTLHVDLGLVAGLHELSSLRLGVLIVAAQFRPLLLVLSREQLAGLLLPTARAAGEVQRGKDPFS